MNNSGAAFNQIKLKTCDILYDKIHKKIKLYVKCMSKQFNFNDFILYYSTEPGISIEDNAVYFLESHTF